MGFQIYKNPPEIGRFLRDVQAAADANRRALGFLPASVYSQSAIQGKLWVAASCDGGHYLGHLLFGGSFPYLRVTQLFVDPAQRGLSIGSRLIEELVAYGEKYGYISVSARVADDLPANIFWERAKFQCSRQISGGKTTGRKINFRTRLLDVPLLFEPTELQGGPKSAAGSNIEYEGDPVLRAPNYALDINSLLDLLRQRDRYEPVSSVIRAGFNHVVRLVLTHEAKEELSRKGTSLEQSPALEFLRQLPVLPSAASSELFGLTEDLRSIVFPRRSRARKDAAKDSSDLVHLATCIHYRLAGFVTSERALLRAAQEIKRQFGVDVLSPFEFLDPDWGLREQVDIVAQTGQHEVRVSLFEEQNRGEVERFLLQIGLTREECRLAMDPGASGEPRTRLCALVNGNLAGFSCWNMPKKLRPESDFFIYADESEPLGERIIEHLIEKASREKSPVKVHGIRLHHGPGQTLTRRIALSRGFRSRSASPGSSRYLFKVSSAGVVAEPDWQLFRDRVRDLAGVEVEASMSSYEQATASGIAVRQPHRRDADLVSLFDLETLMSPGIFLFPGRGGLLIPIQERFAEDLLGYSSGQMSLLPAKEALLRTEKAYFRVPKGTDLFHKGMTIVFYISGHGGGPKKAIGSARITSSAVMSIDQAFVQYYQQGVLERKALSSYACNGNIHVITFDNLCWFWRPLPYTTLQEIGCVGGANLVTAQRLNYSQMFRLLTAAFAVE